MGEEDAREQQVDQEAMAAALQVNHMALSPPVFGQYKVDPSLCITYSQSLHWQLNQIETGHYILYQIKGYLGHPSS